MAKCRLTSQDQADGPPVAKGGRAAVDAYRVTWSPSGSRPTVGSKMRRPRASASAGREIGAGTAGFPFEGWRCQLLNHSRAEMGDAFYLEIDPSLTLQRKTHATEPTSCLRRRLALIDSQSHIAEASLQSTGVHAGADALKICRRHRESRPPWGWYSSRKIPLLSNGQENGRPKQRRAARPAGVYMLVRRAWSGEAWEESQ